MTAFQFGLVVAMLFVIQVEAGLALRGLEKLHQELGEQDAGNEEREADGVVDELAD